MYHAFYYTRFRWVCQDRFEKNWNFLQCRGGVLKMSAPESGKFPGATKRVRSPEKFDNGNRGGLTRPAVGRFPGRSIHNPIPFPVRPCGCPDAPPQCPRPLRQSGNTAACPSSAEEPRDTRKRLLRGDQRNIVRNPFPV